MAKKKKTAKQLSVPRLSAFKFDPMALDVKKGYKYAQNPLGGLLEIKQMLDTWCYYSWTADVNYDVDQAVSKMYRDVKKLARETRRQLAEEACIDL